MVSYPSLNLVDTVIDEVALEGLDGITLEALWTRLAHRFHDTLPLSKAFMTQVWSICTEVQEFTYYKLPIKRKPLIIIDRYEYVDPDLGIILEPENLPDDIYPHFPINDTATGIKGSCSTYNSRRNITDTVKEYSLDETIEKYGQSLVIVASQALRERALIGDTVCPTLELAEMRYCFLERVGRSRYHGEVTQGKLSLSCLKEDPKSLFYHRKYLLRHKLITKQIHHQKSGGHCYSGSLLHLPRFFVERKPKFIFLAERIIEILKSKDNYVAEYDEIKKNLQIGNSIKKLFKTTFFQKVVKTDLRVPYRTLYPNADSKEWQRKHNPSKEKTIRVVQLLDPTMDIADVWNKDDVHEEDALMDLDISNHKFNVPFLKQANTVIEDCKRDGICQAGLSKKMGLTKLQSRTLLRNLVKLNIVATYMNDIGRQRLTKYVSKKFEKSSEMSKQFKKEMHKMKEFTKQRYVENDETAKNKINQDLEDHDSSLATTTESVEVKSQENNIVGATNNNSHTSTSEMIQKFRAVNKILYKYCVTKYPNRYNCTYLNFVGKSNNEDLLKKKEEGNKDFSARLKASSLYKCIKTNLVTQKPTCEKKSVNEIFSFTEDLQNNEKKNISSITYRLLKRANMIIESVKEHQVIDDLTKLMRMINEEEDKEGYDVKIDKKSLVRLLQKLTKDNLIKNIKVTLSANDAEKNLIFICDPNIDTDHTMIKSAVEQAKVKFCLTGMHETQSGLKSSTTKLAQLAKDADKVKGITKQSGGIPSEAKYDAKAGRRYGYSPKFVRMRTLHIFLYYLVYEHPGEPTLTKNEQLEALRNNGFNASDDLFEECGNIYTTTVSWHMFVPPLPRHNGWPEGWTLMCDVLLRIPLSVFVKLHNVTYTIPGLEDYLNHPIKKHYLIRDIPICIRNTLFFARKYIFDIHETVTRLCYIGLVQFGPQKLKEKDQVFIYVNQRTELMDTISSAPNYHKIEKKVYPTTQYTFNGMQMVEKYWCDMWSICINTPLGGRLVVEGKDIVLENLSKKSEMLQAISARTPEEAKKLDIGKVPGDRQGAAGIDSACFAHLKRNWNWANNSLMSKQKVKSQAKIVMCERDAYLSKIKTESVKFTEFSGLRKVSGPTSVNVTDLKKRVYKHLKGSESTTKQKKHEVLTSQRAAKQKSFVRRVMPKKFTPRMRVRYDETDYRALQKMHKLRVDWEPYEDNILLVCKVAMMYLCPNPHKQLVTFMAVRDVLRSYSFISYNKTSRACQRRLVYMLRQPQTVNSVTLGVEEVKQNFYINKRFGGTIEKIKEECKTSVEQEKRTTEVFKELVAYIAKKYYDISDLGVKEPISVPQTVQEFNIFYKVMHPTNRLHKCVFVNDVRNVNDIHAATINSVIHSSMCSRKDKRSWAYQLFKIYQQYPEALLRNAMAKIRADQMVTIKKNHMCGIKKYDNCMPMSSSQYQFSANYMYKFQTKWPYDIFTEIYDMFIKLTEWYSKNKECMKESISFKLPGCEILPVTGGIVPAIQDYIAQNQLDFDIEVPDQIITLEPRLKEKDETYLRIAQRYQDILNSLDYIQADNEENVLSTYEISGIKKKSKQKREVQSEDDLNFQKHSLKRICGNYAKLERECDIIQKASKSDQCTSDTDMEQENPLEKCSITKGNINNQSNYNRLQCESDEHGNTVMDNDEENNTIPFQDGTKMMIQRENDSSPLHQIDALDINTDQQENLQNMVKHTESMKHTKSLINLAKVTEQSSTDYNKIFSQSEKQTCHVKKRLLNTDEETSHSYVTPTKKIKVDVKPDILSNNCKIINDTLLPEAELQIGELNRNSKGAIFKAYSQNMKDNTHRDSSSVSNLGKIGVEECKTNDTITEISKSNKADKVQRVQESTFTRVSEMIANIPPAEIYVNPNCKFDETTDIRKRHTRIALLRMREELNDLSITDSHHAQEYFAVNTFKILYTLYSKHCTEEDKPFKEFTLPSELIPLAIDTANEFIQNVNRSVLFPKDVISYLDYKKIILNNARISQDNVDTVHNFVLNKREMGATIQELVETFQATVGKDLFCIVHSLQENHIFLRCGVTAVRYIHYSYAEPWMIHTCKMYRLDRDAMLPMPKGCTYTVGDTAQAKEKSAENNENPECYNLIHDNTIAEKFMPETTCVAGNKLANVCENLNDNENDGSGNKNHNCTNKHSSSDSEGECNSLINRRIQKKKTPFSEEKVTNKDSRQIDLTSAESVGVVIKPWIRVDGILNRRVLDRMLGAVLTYCLTHPGVTMAKVQNRFIPALQQFHTHELVEMLIQLGCLQKRVLRKTHITLFSKPTSLIPESDDDFATEEEIFIEPVIGATLKFSIFLSTKSYSSDIFS